MTREQCECDFWCSHDVGLAAIVGHHENCPRAQPVRALRLLVEDLVRGMEAWAADEDGVHDQAWDAYARGKTLIGEIAPDLEGER